MKPIRIALTPTRNRALNMLLGALLIVLAALLLLSLATYHASDPSLNTSTAVAGPHSVRNLLGPAGAYTSDLMLQTFGVSAFSFPLWIGGLGWVWARSRSNGSAWLRWTGVILTLTFLPACFGLIPWRWHWLHAMPIEGFAGRLVADQLVVYVNTLGAWIVAGLLAALGIYLGSHFSFRAAWEWSQERSIQLSAWHDRWRNWQADRADRKAEKEAIRRRNWDWITNWRSRRIAQRLASRAELAGSSASFDAAGLRKTICLTTFQPSGASWPARTKKRKPSCGLAFRLASGPAFGSGQRLRPLLRISLTR